MSNYALIDHIIKDWAKKHSLKLNVSFGGMESRYVYLSSIKGECFQIFISPPSGGSIDIYAACLEGRRENDLPEKWTMPSQDLAMTLEKAYHIVINWMGPSERFFRS